MSNEKIDDGKINDNKMSNGKKVTWKMISFEIRNTIGNPFVHIFGILFPILMSILICKGVESDISDATILKSAQTQIILGIGTIIPLATIFMGYACQYAQELEKEIPLRMFLFGFKEKYTIINRIIAEFIFMSVAFVLYFSVTNIVFDLIAPSVGGIVLYMVLLYIVSGILFVLSHAIASLIKKFGATYAIVMILYFAIMMLSGMMGIKAEALPTFLQSIAKLIPFYYYNQSEFLALWKGETYQFVPLMQGMMFFGAIAGIILFIALRKNNRRIQ